MIEYLEDASDLTPEQLVGFFEGWPNHPSPDTHLRILRSSFATVVALDASSGEVVGFGTSISDGVLAAYIPLLEVRPDYRRQGIGSELVRRLLARLNGLYMIDLFCDEELVPFYERFGMTAARGMVRRNREAQSGSAT